MGEWEAPAQCPHVRCLARHSAAGSLPALAGAPHPPMSPTAGAHWLHRRRHAVVVVASQSVRSVGKKKLGTFRVAQRGSNDVNARAGALVLHARRNATSLQNHQSPRSARARRRRPLQLIWRIHTYRHHTAASSLNFRESEAIALVHAEQQHCSTSPLSRCIFALSNRLSSVSLSSGATNAAAALLQQPAAAQPGQAASKHACIRRWSDTQTTRHICSPMQVHVASKSSSYHSIVRKKLKQALSSPRNTNPTIILSVSKYRSFFNFIPIHFLELQLSIYKEKFTSINIK